jgi:hypothetical protein
VPPQAEFIRGRGDIRLYKSIEGSGTHGVVLVNPAWKLNYAKGMGPTLCDYIVYAVNYLLRPSALTVDMNRSPSEVAFAPDREEAQAMQRDPLVVRYFSLRYLLTQRKLRDDGQAAGGVVHRTRRPVKAAPLGRY